ncbi:hypothetical protein ElyMa_003366800 [Elysia marginata]|uniref:Uncharacterized protein n=1 Tax=Elysia marginata TaxID=1093978 RepID=A0AAV4JIE1_9GAST|nr:hypothetical protein ElyMa_003366800 [Elysia marginata]
MGYCGGIVGSRCGEKCLDSGSGLFCWSNRSAVYTNCNRPQGSGSLDFPSFSQHRAASARFSQISFCLPGVFFIAQPAIVCSRHSQDLSVCGWRMHGVEATRV